MRDARLLERENTSLTNPRDVIPSTSLGCLSIVPSAINALGDELTVSSDGRSTRRPRSRQMSTEDEGLSVLFVDVVK